MKLRSGKPGAASLVVLALFSCIIFVLAEKTAHLERQPHFEKKLEAAKLALVAREAIKAYEKNAGLSIDIQNDPYQTGLIGQERTLITTDRGVFTSKVLSTNPNFAAVFVTMLIKANVKPHEVVAIGMTGSFPGLNIAVLAACKALDLNPIIITSVGASDWGANQPQLTWLDMEKVLGEQGVLSFKSVAASIGGGSDNGRGLSPEGRDLLKAAIIRNGVTFIDEESVEANIARRMKIYKRESKDREIACYINIGGGIASLGGTQNARLIPPGLIRHLAVKNYPTHGIINLMAEQGLPVINALNVEKIAEQYGFPLELSEKESPLGGGILFFKNRYSVTNTIILTIILITVVFIVIKVDIGYYFRKRNDSRPITRV
jgi:poly-gamma-glutamate system protein